MSKEYSSRKDALAILDQCGIMYKNDFKRLLTYDNQYKGLKDKKLIIEKELLKQGKKVNGKKTETIVAISPEGKEDYLYKGKNSYINVKDNKNYITASKMVKKCFYSEKEPSENVISNKIWPYLTQQKVKTLFAIAGVCTFPYEKPSFKYLWYQLSKNKKGHKLIIDEDYEDIEYENISEENKIKKLKNALNMGIYYTKNEVTDMFDYYSLDSDDAVKGLIFQGIFLSNKTCLIIFVASYGENKRIQYSTGPMSKLIDFLKNVINDPQDPITNVYRSIPCISESAEPSRYVQHGINALVFSIGDQLVYSMATGFKRGRQKDVDLVELNLQARAKGAKSKELLDVINTQFDRIFTVQSNDKGIQDLMYLTNMSIEDWHKQMSEMCESDSRFSKSTSQFPGLTPYVYDEYNAPAIYMPIHEIMFYAQVFREKEKYNKVAFIVDPKYPVEDSKESKKKKTKSHTIADTISHCVRKLDGLYFINTKGCGTGVIDEEVSEKEYFLYDGYGNKAGVKIVEDFLKKNHKQLKGNKDYVNINKKQNIPSSQRFYNNIAKGKMSVEAAIGDLNDYDNIKETEKKSNKQLNISVKNEIYEKFLSLKKARGTNNSDSSLAKELFIQALEYELKKIKSKQ